MDSGHVNRTGRRKLGLLGGLLVLAALLLLVLDLAADRLALVQTRELIEKDLADFAGAPVEIESLHVDVLPRPLLTARGVTVANPGAARTPHLLEVERLYIQLEALPLLHGLIRVWAIELDGATLTLEMDPDGGLDLPLALDELVDESDDEEGDGLDFRARQLRAQNLRVFRIDADGGVTSARIFEIAMDADQDDNIIELDLRGELEGAPFELSGKLGRLIELLEPTGPFPVDLEGRIFEVAIGLKGSIADISTLSGLSLDLHLELDSFDWAGAGRIPLGQVVVDAHLSELDGSIGLETLEARTVGEEPFEGRLTGHIDDLAALREVDLALAVGAPDIGFLAPLTGLVLPELDHARINLELTDEDGSLGLQGELRVEVLGGRGWLELRGGDDDVTRLAEVDLHFEAGAQDSDVLALFVPQLAALPDGMPSRASGRLLAHDGQLTLQDLDLFAGDREIAWIQAQGQVKDLLSRQGVEIDIAYRIDDLARVGVWVGRTLPSVGPLTGSAALYDSDGSLGIEDLIIESDDGDDLELEAVLALDDLLELDEIEAVVRFEARDLAVLGELLDVELPALGPVELSAQMAGSNEYLDARELVLQVGETRFQSDLRTSFGSDARPTLAASVEAPFVRLSDVGITLELLDHLFDAPGGGGELPLEQLRGLDGTLTLHVQRTVGVDSLDVRDLDASFRLEDGALTGDLDFEYRLGHVKAALAIDASEPKAAMQAEVDVRALDLGRLMAQFDEETPHSGLLDLFLEARTEGRRSEDLLAALTGELRVSARDTSLVSSYAQRFVVDLTSAVMPDFLMPEDGPGRIGCAAFELRVDDGVARLEHLLVQENEISITGSGNIELIPGNYDLMLSPKTSNPGVISLAPEVHVVGPLADPDFEPITRTFATSLGRGLVTNLKRLGALAARPFRERDEDIQRGQKLCERIGIGEEALARTP